MPEAPETGSVLGFVRCEALKVILSLQNEIRELKGKPALKDVDELKVESRKTVVSSLNAPEEIRKAS